MELAILIQHNGSVYDFLKDNSCLCWLNTFCSSKSSKLNGLHPNHKPKERREDFTRREQKSFNSSTNVLYFEVASVPLKRRGRRPSRDRNQEQLQFWLMFNLRSSPVRHICSPVNIRPRKPAIVKPTPFERSSNVTHRLNPSPPLSPANGQSSDRWRTPPPPFNTIYLHVPPAPGPRPGWRLR